MKAEKSILFIFYIFCVQSIFFESCSTPSMLVSSSHNVPLLTKKNETRIEAGTGTQYFGVQASHAFTNHFEMMGTYSYGQSYGPVFFMQDIVAGDPGLRNGGELALGYFSRIDSLNPYEIFVGSERYFRFYGTNYRSANITKPFVQADIGIMLSRKLHLILSCRVGYLMFDHYKEYHIPGIDSSFNNQQLYGQPLNIGLIEPSAMLKFGRKKLNFFIQYGLSIPTKYLYLDSQILFFNLGLSYKILGRPRGAAANK